MSLTVYSMLVFAFVGAISPGPVNIIAASIGANSGVRCALPHVLGATLSYTLIVCLVGIGLNTVLAENPIIAQTLQYFGAAFLLYMSFKIATAEPASIQVDSSSASSPFLGGVLAQALNPKAWLVSMSGVSLFVTQQDHPVFFLMLFCVISFAMCFVGVGSWALLGNAIRGYLAEQQHQIIFNRIMGVLLSSSIITLFIPM